MSKGLRTYVRTIVIAFLVLVGAVLAIALTMFVVHRVQVAQIRGLYDEMVAVSEQEEYPRPPDPPGWDLEPGSAADLYKEAVASCPQISTLSNTSAANLRSARMAMLAGPQADADQAPLRGTATGPIPRECIEAGVPENSQDPVVMSLDAALCQVLLDCDEALELLLAGTRRTDTQSPYGVWSDWGVDPTNGIDVAHGIGFHLKLKLLVLRGYIAELRGERGALVDASLGAVRLGGDLSRGADYYGGLTGCAMQYHGASTIAVLLRDGMLDPATATRLQRELAYINRQPIDQGDPLAGEVMTSIAMFGYTRDDDPIPPKARATVVYSSSAQAQLDRFLMAGDLCRIWRDALSAREDPYPVRLAVYSRLEEESITGYPAMSGLARFPAQLDAKVTLSNTHLELLELAAAATVMRMETGAAPSSLDDLLAFNADLPTVDLFTGEPYEVAIEGDLCVIQSPAATAARHAEVGLDRVLNIDPTERLVVKTPSQVEKQEHEAVATVP